MGYFMSTFVQDFTSLMGNRVACSEVGGGSEAVHQLHIASCDNAMNRFTVFSVKASFQHNAMHASQATQR